MDLRINQSTGQIAVRDDSTGKYAVYERGDYKFNPQLNEYAIPQADGKFMRIPAPRSAARESTQQSAQPPQSLPGKATANNRSLPRPGQAEEERRVPLIDGGTLDLSAYSGDRARLDAPGQDIGDILAQNTLAQARNSFPFANQTFDLVNRLNQGGNVAQAFSDNTAQGVLLEGGDELAGGAAALGNIIGLGNEGETPEQAYQRRADEIRNRIEVENEANPNAALAGTITGIGASVALPGGPVSRFIGGGRTGLGKVGRGLFGGAGIGAAQGFNSGVDPEDRRNQALIGGLVGGGAGGFAPIVTGLAGRGYRAVREGVESLFNRGQSPIENAAGRAAIDASQDLPLANQVEDILSPVINTGTRADYNAGIGKIAENLSRDNIPITNVRRALGRLGDQATIADLGENTQSLLQSVASQPGPAKRITANFLDARQTAQRGRIIDRARNLLNASGKSTLETADEIVSQQQKAAAPLYEDAFKNSSLVDTKPILDSLNNRLQTAKGGIRTTLEKARGLLVDSNGRPEIELRSLHETKIALDDAIDAANKDSSIGKIARRELINVRNDLLSAIDTANPKYKEARDVFAGYERSKEALDLGRNIFKGDAELNAREIAALSDSEKELVREGAFNAIQDSINSIPRGADAAKRLNDIEAKIGRLRPVFPSDEVFNEFRGVLQSEAQKFQTRSKVLSGSQTQERLAAQDDLSGIPLLEAGSRALSGQGGDITNALRLGSRFADALTSTGSSRVTEAGRAQIARALTEASPDAQVKILEDIERALALREFASGAGQRFTRSAPRSGAEFIAPELNN